MGQLTAITINWTGAVLSAEQMAVIQDAALDFDERTADARLVFEHPLCDGIIECKGRMQHVEFRGTRFLATLDSVDGTPRIYEFLLMDYYTKSQIRSAKRTWRVDTRNGKREEVDAGITRKTRTSTFKRSRTN